MSDVSLLPPSATDQERAIDLSTARIGDVPVLVREAWNPDTCPVELLPWLAWAFSVDEWQNTWTEAEQRAVIKNALYVHKKKGTLAALKQALAPLGYNVRIVEWFEETPAATPYTFTMEVGVEGKGIDEAIYSQIERLALAYKNVRSYIRALTISGKVTSQLYFGAAMTSGVETTILPYIASDLESIGLLYWALAEQTADTVVIFPSGSVPVVSLILDHAGYGLDRAGICLDGPSSTLSLGLDNPLLALDTLGIHLD